MAKTNEITAPETPEVTTTAKAANTKKAKSKAWLEEKVPVKLFKDNGKYKDDVYLNIGNESCLIRRGETVMIKRKFKLLLEQTERQKQAATAVQARASQNGNWN